MKSTRFRALGLHTSIHSGPIYGEKGLQSESHAVLRGSLVPYFSYSLFTLIKGTSFVLVGVFPDRRLYLEKVRTQSAERGNERIIWTAKYQQVPIPFNEAPEGQPRT
jgi:hypothetical protein